MTERWIEIPDWPYAVSDRGRVRRTVRYNNTPPDGILTQTRGKNGYLTAHMCKVGAPPRTVAVHRLVTEIFLGPPPTPAHQAAHRDGVKENNRLSNLRWATMQENRADQVLHGTVPCGERISTAKCTAEVVRAIRTSGIQTSVLAAKYGISSGNVRRIRRGESWRQVA